MEMRQSRKRLCLLYYHAITRFEIVTPHTSVYLGVYMYNREKSFFYLKCGCKCPAVSVSIALLTKIVRGTFKEKYGLEQIKNVIYAVIDPYNLIKAILLRGVLFY